MGLVVGGNVGKKHGGSQVLVFGVVTPCELVGGYYCFFETLVSTYESTQY